MSKHKSMKFTPTEELILETLQARIRLGENSWSYSSRLKPSFERLRIKGLVNFKSVPVENTLLAWPTAQGKILLFSEKYRERLGSKASDRRQKALRKEAKKLRKRGNANGES